MESSSIKVVKEFRSAEGLKAVEGKKMVNETVFGRNSSTQIIFVNGFLRCNDNELIIGAN